MSYYALSALVNFIASLALGGLTLLQNPRNKVKYLFSLFAFDVAFWSLAYYFWQISQDIGSAFFWSKALMAFAIFIPIIYLHFVFALLGIVKKRLNILIPSYIIFSIFLLFDLFTPYYIKEIKPLFGFPFWPIAGIAFHPFIVIWVGFVVYASFLLFQLRKNSSGLLKLQANYIFWGMVIGFIGGSTNYLMWYQIPLPPLGNILVSVYVAMTAYAIIKHRFLNINLAVRKVFIYLFAILLVFLLGIVITFFLTGFAAITVLNWATISTIAFGAGAVTIILPKLLKFAEIFLDKVYFGRTISYQDSLAKLAGELPKILDLSALVDLIIKTLMETMGLSRAAILIADFETKDFKIVKTIGFDEHNGISLVKDNFLTQFLEKNRKSIVLEELEKITHEANNVTEKTNLQQLIKNMIHIEAAAIIPIIAGDKLTSLIVLGNKKGGDAYFVEDMKLLEIIAAQASFAIENARLYREVNNFNQNLQQKVDEATAEVQKKNIDLNKAYEDLKSLDKMKDQLISIASHELRTPASNVRNYLWMVLTRPKTTLDLEDKSKLEKSFQGIQNLLRLINDLLDASRIEGGKLEVNLQPVDYNALIKDVISELTLKAQNKGLTLSYTQSFTLLPGVIADPTRLKEVLTNLVTNAIKYTQRGGISISTTQKDNEITFSIKDTGKGVAPENLPKLFQKFYREDTSLSASNPETGGTGLGLYITKSMVELMHGKIWIDSIQGQGSTFYFSLPAISTVSPSITKYAKKAYKGIFTREDYLKMKTAKGQSDTQETASSPLPSFVVPEPQSSKKKLLLVEDEAEMRQFYGDFLAEKYEVETAVEGGDGLAKLRLNKFDLILLDIMMPKMDGVGFLQEKQKDPEIANIPVILLTNLGEEETLAKCFELGVKSMIMKSDVLPDQIIPVIEKEFQQITTS